MVSINSTGFCGKTDHNVTLLLYVTKFEDGTLKHKPHFISGVQCNSSTVMSLHGFKYYKGKISVENQSIQVSSGSYLSIRIECLKEECYFQPARVNKTNHTVEYFTDGPVPEILNNLSLLFSAKILSGTLITPDQHKTCLKYY